MNSDESRLNFPMDECPYCGSEFFIRRIRFKGFGVEVYTGDGLFSDDNSGLYDHVEHILNKRFYCNDCDKYLFKLD
ncbi:hypothetical protein [Lactococcus garvieae]|uniref:hypothetical protein n=1 Tax=Lactococcus garvieae TaxID=1363 RepID=UPI0005B3CEBD|nr:hypothetical protein [Lactococcus garvieae]